MPKLVSGVALAMLSGLTSGGSLAAQSNADTEVQHIRELLGSIGVKGQSSRAYFASGDRYTEHAPVSPVGQLVLQSADASTTTTRSATMIRALRDGAFVITQSEYVSDARLIIIDIFRFERGTIVEHWANVEKLCETTNPSGRTQLDGPTQVTDLNATEKNKAAVDSYFQDVVFGAYPDRVSQYKNLADFHQHNCQASHLKDGVPLVKPAFTFRIQKLERILGQGNFVLAISTGLFDDVPMRFYDLYRLEGGKQVEHWDVLQEIR